MQKNSYLLHGNHGVHDEQLNKLHLCQMQMRSEFLRDTKHFVPGPQTAFSCTSTSLGTLEPPTQFKPGISEGFEK